MASFPTLTVFLELVLLLLFLNQFVSYEKGEGGYGASANLFSLVTVIVILYK